MSRIKDIQRQTGFSKETKRSPEDYYVTPDIAVKELLKREKFEGLGWEPCCGNGAISKFFPNMLVSDIRKDNTVIGDKRVDFSYINRIIALRSKVKRELHRRKDKWK